LTHTHRQTPHLRVGIDLKTQGLAHGADARAMDREPQNGDGAPEAKHDILGYGQCVGETEMLMDHPDSQPDRILGRTQVDGLAVDAYLAQIGPIDPIQDIHQTRFTGAILSKHGMDRRLVDIEHDLIECAECAECLGNAVDDEMGGGAKCGRLMNHGIPPTSSVIACRSPQCCGRRRIGVRQTGWTTKLPDFIFSSRPLTSLATGSGTFEWKEPSRRAVGELKSNL
jgi:hypothetical protein